MGMRIQSVLCPVSVTGGMVVNDSIHTCIHEHLLSVHTSAHVCTHILSPAPLLAVRAFQPSSLIGTTTNYTDNYTKMCWPGPPCKQGLARPQAMTSRLLLPYARQWCSDHHPLYQPSQAVWPHFSGSAELKAAKLDKQVLLALWKTTKDSHLMWPVAVQPAPFSLAPLQPSCCLCS